MAQENQDSKKRAAVGKMTGFIGYCVTCCWQAASL